MIKMLRIDERLIHGQVAMIWSKHLGIDRIVVVNEKAALDPILASTLKMAAPDTIKVIVLGHEKAKVLFNDPRTANLKILVVVNSPQDALFVTENVDGLPKVNVGNYGRVEGKTSEKEKINDNLYLGAEDKTDLRKIMDLGVPVEYQLVPDQSVTDLSEIIL